MHNNHILFVDDDAACRDAMGSCLSSQGQSFQKAQDATSALGLAQRQPFGLLISDFDMPGMNGVELFKEIRKVQPEIEGILISGDLTDSRKSAALEAGMMAAFHKPLELPELFALVATTCRRAA
jgi:DNA-binding NtrC family response regulator